MAIDDHLIREPYDAYHRQRRGHVTSGSVRDFRSRNAYYFREKQLGRIPGSDSDAFLVGRAAHTLILEGEAAYKERYAVGGPINEKTGKCFGRGTKTFREWAANHGDNVEFLTAEEHALCTRMAESVAAHKIARDVLAAGEPEVVLRGKYMHVPCQIRMDWLSPIVNLIVDLKTCQDIDAFDRDTRKFGYTAQAAFYCGVYEAIVGEMPGWLFIAVEKQPPYRTGMFDVAPHVMETEKAANEAALQRIQNCRAGDLWPTGYENVRTLSDM